MDEWNEWMNGWLYMFLLYKQEVNIAIRQGWLKQLSKIIYSSLAGVKPTNWAYQTPNKILSFTEKNMVRNCQRQMNVSPNIIVMDALSPMDLWVNFAIGNLVFPLPWIIMKWQSMARHKIPIIVTIWTANLCVYFHI